MASTLATAAISVTAQLRTTKMRRTCSVQSSCYRDCIMEALKNERGRSEDKMRIIMALLQRMREDEDAEDGVTDLK